MIDDLRSASVSLCRRQIEGHVARYTQRPLRVLLFASEKVRISFSLQGLLRETAPFISESDPHCVSQWDGNKKFDPKRRGFAPSPRLETCQVYRRDSPKIQSFPGPYWVGLMRGLLGLRVMKFRWELAGCVFSSEGSPTNSAVITLSYCKG